MPADGRVLQRAVLCARDKRHGAATSTIIDFVLFLAIFSTPHHLTRPVLYALVSDHADWCR